MKKTFWDRTAKIYDRFMRKDHKAYKQVVERKLFGFPAETGLECAKKRSAESQFPVDLCRVCKGVKIMERKDAIQNAYRLAGSNSFYDGMITCSTVGGKAVWAHCLLQTEVLIPWRLAM